MISITKEDLNKASEIEGYRAENLEKVYRLLDLLNVMMQVPYLKERIALKGGTAINLFCTKQLPRLSVDLDFNYINSVDRETMLEEKQQIKNIMHNIFENEGYRIARSPNAHAGGKQIWEFDSLLNRKGLLEIDMNYLYRNPLWQPSWQYAKAWNSNAGVNVLDIHELAAGKLHALLDRDAARDLFDSYQLLTSWPLDTTKLRLAFTVYAGIREKGWKALNTNLINFDVKNIRNKLIPVLKREIIPGTKYNEIEPWGEQLVIGCKNAFERLLPFNDNEIKFLSSLDQGYIRPELLTSDEQICEAVSKHPALHWRIMQKK